MAKHLLLVDYENVHKVDLSVLDDSYQAIIFVGATQNPPRAVKNKANAHRFNRVEFQKIAGSGKNALDFHIAFHLGRTFETAPGTVCIVLSRDKGYDPLLLYINQAGLQCRRVESFDELVTMLICRKCKNTATIEHHGGRWCPTCGLFASPPDPALLPSQTPRHLEPNRRLSSDLAFQDRQHSGSLVCGWCHEESDMTGGIYDDGEWMCGGCIAQYAR